MKDCIFTPTRLLVASLVTIIILLVVIGSSSAYNQENTEAIELTSASPTTLDDENPFISAIIVVRAASGNSYMAEREYIASMPELETQEEIEAFIAKYEPNPEEIQAVVDLLVEAGFTIISHDNLFIMVKGQLSEFQKVLPNLDLFEGLGSEKSRIALQNIDLGRGSHDIVLIDGIIFNTLTKQQKPDNTLSNNTQSALDFAKLLNNTSYYRASYSDLQKALKFDRVHAQGLTGKGVNVGIIDDGVFSGHKFFLDYPTTMKYYRYLLWAIVETGNNFDEKVHSNHGTAVASFISVTAPDATLHSFANPSGGAWTHPKGDWLLEYLIHINYGDLVDVLSISQGISEELFTTDEDFEWIAEVRTVLISLLSKKTIILVASGNTPQYYEGVPLSGHNFLAAVPEVIAVGGSSLIPIGSNFVFSAAPNASSFNSSLFSGRAVPDIVGIYGNFYVPDKNNSYSWEKGTSLATPQIAGMVALLKQQNPEINQSQVKSVLTNNTFDIIDGTNYHGVPAGPGYDLPTGYGQPLAHWVTQETMVLHSGYNLIGITKDANYTGVSLLKEIYAQGGDCDTISYYDSSIAMYESVLVEPDGTIYGWDFDVKPELGYWIRCWNKSYWKQSGNSYIDHEIPLDLRSGWNLISIPYSSAPCTTKQLYHDTNGKCTRVVEYDGQLKEFQQRLIGYGNNFTLSPGKGYFVLCNERVVWTPSCTDGLLGSLQEVNNPPDNIFQPRSSKGIDRFSSIDVTNPIFLEAIDGSVLPNDDKDEFYFAQHTDSSTTHASIDNFVCTPKSITVTNVSEQSFSVSWLTTEPCPGTLFISLGEGNYSQAFDDRGMRYSGLTHHVTVRGLSPETQYYYLIDTGYDLLGHYVVETGNVLSHNSTAYLALGQILDANLEPFEDSIVYINLSDGSNSSSKLSFSMGELTEGFTVPLGNARNTDLTAYYPNSSATKLNINYKGGILEGWDSLNINLNTTPEVLVTDFNLGKIPNKPSILSPTTPVMMNSPLFHFVSDGDSSHELQYRLEISRDNFSTIEYVFDQRNNPTGWSSASYSPGAVASFRIPISLENFSGYQWRVFAFDSNAGTWSSSSEIKGFSIVVYRTYLPFLTR